MSDKLRNGDGIIKTITIICACLVLSCGIKRPTATLSIQYLQENPSREDKPPEIKLRDDDFEEEFKKVFKKMSGDLPYPQLIYKFYEGKKFQPVLTPRFLPGNQLQVLLEYLNKSDGHGLDTALFSPGTIKTRMNKLNERDAGATPENFRNIAALELAVAGSLIRYSNALQFGVTDPFRIYKSYTTPTLAPDSSSVIRIFEIQDLKGYLAGIQPADITYQAMQKMLITFQSLSDDTQLDTVRALIVNLERLRWKNKPAEPKYVSVNIANFTLDVVDKEESVLHMKVCVGEPGDRETPQLGSMIHSVQVNPVWNIPQSIARNEIAKRAAEDRYYLANSNINVYRKGKLISNPESIDWSSADLEEYTFQQQPGGENALGRIKFLFNNKSSVYLHDTPAQSAFKMEMRAISHGCVRVEKPLEFAFALFGKGPQYTLIKKAMQRGYPRARYVALPLPIPIRLYYFTAWADINNKKIRFCKDVYGLDEVVYNAIQKID